MNNEKKMGGLSFERDTVRVLRVRSAIRAGAGPTVASTETDKPGAPPRTEGWTLTVMTKN